MKQFARRLLFSFSVLAVVLGFADAGAQTVITLTPSADSYVQQGTPTTNYGTATTMLARIDSANSLTRAAYLQFNLSSLPQGTITSAVLQVFGSHDQGGAGVTIAALRGTATASWSETQLNWNNAASLTGVDLNSTPISTRAVAPPPSTTYSWDVTSYINERRSAGNATVALYPTAVNTFRATFNSKEATANRPQLVVTINGSQPPPPGTVTLTPIADAYTQEGMPTTNFGTANTLLVRKDSANTLSRNGYLEFDLSSIPAGTITSATLRLFGSQDQGGAGVNIEAHSGTATSTWSETALNHNNQFSLTGVGFNAGDLLATTLVSPPPSATYSWDVTSYIAARRSIGHATIGLDYTAANTYRSTFNSKEATANRPQLVVTVNGSSGGGTPTLFYLNYNGTVNRVGTTGSGRTTLVSSAGLGADGIALDVANNHMYWTTMGQDSVNDGRIQRANLNGSNVVTIIPSGGTFTPKQMKLDLQNRKMYWADREGMRVMRANLDGTNIETLVTTGTTSADRTDASRWCVGISLDIPGGKIYWTQKGGDDGPQGPRNRGSIRRANVNIPAGQTSSNRTDIEVMFSGLSEPVDLDVDLSQRLIYWTDRGDHTISRSTMDLVNGSRTRTILGSNLGEAIGITLDKSTNRIFYTNVEGIVGRIPLAGGAATSILTGQGILTGIQLVQLP